MAPEIFFRTKNNLKSVIKLVVIYVLVILNISRNTKQHYDWLWLKSIINPCGANSVQQIDFGGGFINILLNGLLWQWMLYSKKVFKTSIGFKKTSVLIPAFKKGRAEQFCGRE